LPRGTSSLSSVKARHIHTDQDHYFGVAIIGAVIVQAGFGWYHHRRFVQNKPSSRRWFTNVHLWLGRILILCGMVNCGFGFPLSDVQFRWAVIWWICCGILAALYLLAYIILALIQERNAAKGINQSNETSFAPTPSRGMEPQANTVYDLYRYYPGYASPLRHQQNTPDQYQPYWIVGSERDFHPSSVYHNSSSQHF
jgi:hypothetical protein